MLNDVRGKIVCQTHAVINHLSGKSQTLHRLISCYIISFMVMGLLGRQNLCVHDSVCVCVHGCGMY